MRPSRLAAILFFTLSLLCFSNAGSLQTKAEPYVIAIANTAPPKVPIKEILTLAYKEIGIDVQFKEMPAKRSIHHANRGLADAEAFRVKGIESEYTCLIRIDVPVRRDDMHFYVLKGKEFAVHGWQSIPKDYLIGYRRGLLLAEIAVKKYGLRSHELTKVDNVGQHLNAGRSDVIIFGPVKGRLFDEFEKHNVVRLDPPIYKTVLYHYVHKKHAELVKPLTKALEKLHKSGKINEINSRIKELYETPKPSEAN